MLHSFYIKIQAYTKALDNDLSVRTEMEAHEPPQIDIKNETDFTNETVLYSMEI